MEYLKWKATRMHTGHGWAFEDKVLITTSGGEVVAWVPETEAGADIQVLDGVICPGFVNAHCHLELSHLKGHIPPQCGMVNFLMQVMQLNRFRKEEKEQAMQAALTEMSGNGIVAVGDISNGTDSIALKANADIYFHNFIEITGFVPASMHERWQAGQAVAHEFLKVFPAKQVTITPHAPYSVSTALLDQIIRHSGNHTLSFHLMESEDELAFFNDKQGDFMRLYAHLGLNLDFFTAPGTNPIQHLWSYMQHHKPWLWVHNTETGLQHLHWLAANGVDWNNVFFCLCPGANQYINMATPSIHRFRDQFPLQFCLGTDSLAGNYYLNPVYEMRLMQKHGRLNNLDYLLQMATLNGAKALGIEETFGSLTTGKKPGLLLLKDIQGDQITPKTKVEVLL